MEVGTVFWKIRNFSCWHETLHERSIGSPIIVGSGCEEIDLYPKGQNNDEEHLQIILTPVVIDFSCEVFFYGSDGFLIHKLEGSTKRGESTVKLPPGPKFKDVVAQIWSKEALLKDCHCLEFRFKDTDLNSVHNPYPELRFCTTIEVSQIRSEIDLKFLEYSKTDPLIIYSDYDKRVSLKNVSESDEKVDVQFALVGYESKVFCAKTHLYLKNSTCVLIPKVNKELMQSDEAPLTVASILRVKDLIGKNTIVHFNLKIIDGNMFHSYEFVFRHRPIEQKNKQVVTQAQSVTKCSIDDLVESLIPLYKSLPLPDIKLRCQNISLPAHKNILNDHSPVFRNLLTMESDSDYLDVDLDAQTLAGLLIYLYTKSIMDHLQWKEILNLFDAGHKYQIHPLKEICVPLLCASVSLTNVSEILVSGDKHKEIRLVSAARSFISLLNYKEVLDSYEWKKALETKSNVILETTAHLEAFRKIFNA